MVYPCFYYSMKLRKKVNKLIFGGLTKIKFEKARKVASYVHFGFTSLVIFLQIKSTILVSSQDRIEFRMRFSDSILLAAVIIEYAPWVLLTEDKFSSLVNSLKTKFSSLDARIVYKCKEEEKIWFISILTLNFLGKVKKYTANNAQITSTVVLLNH